MARFDLGRVNVLVKLTRVRSRNAAPSESGQLSAAELDPERARTVDECLPRLPD